jgi:SAM-dependent methyltransferase
MYDSNEYFKAYFDKASEKALLIDLMQERFNPPKDELSILDLGCHDGALIKKIINTYTSRMPRKVAITGVEPSSQALLKYKKNQFNIPVQTNTFDGTAEHFFIKKQKNDNYNWVIASQCLYWTLDLASVIQDIADCGDSALIVLRGKRGIYEIQSRFKDYIGNPNEQFYTAEDIELALIKLNIPFEKQIKTTFIELPRQGSQEMKWLIAFFLQQNHNQLSHGAWQEVESWLLSKGTEKIAHNVCFFWLGKAMLASCAK